VISAVTGAIGLTVAFVILALIRRDKLHVSHGLWWVAVAAGFALLGVTPSIIDEVASWLGVAYPPVLGLTTAVALLVLKMLAMDIERSRIEMRYQRLTQKIGMLEAELAELRRAVEVEQAPGGDDPTGRS
jgi:hypothetical protein